MEIDNDDLFSLTVGRSYLVFARRDTQTLRFRMDIASGTKDVKEASRELATVRRFVSMKATERIVMGNAQDSDDGNEALPNFEFTLTCDQRQYPVKSGPDGIYEIRIVKPSAACQFHVPDGWQLKYSSDIRFSEPATCVDSVVWIGRGDPGNRQR